jgi:hypothetical protein
MCYRGGGRGQVTHGGGGDKEGVYRGGVIQEKCPFIISAKYVSFEDLQRAYNILRE